MQAIFACWSESRNESWNEIFHRNNRQGGNGTVRSLLQGNFSDTNRFEFQTDYLSKLFSQTLRKQRKNSTWKKVQTSLTLKQCCTVTMEWEYLSWTLWMRFRPGFVDAWVERRKQMRSGNCFRVTASGFCWSALTKRTNSLDKRLSGTSFRPGSPKRELNSKMNTGNKTERKIRG